jgi:hypothetical protein
VELCYFRTMATIKDAVNNASTFAVETLGPERAGGLQLEEVESANVNGDEVWQITLSMLGPLSVLDLSPLLERKREYKIFTVSKKTGEVTSMKIRELALT